MVNCAQGRSRSATFAIAAWADGFCWALRVIVEVLEGGEVDAVVGDFHDVAEVAEVH